MKSEKFAKIFESEKFGQILATSFIDDDQVTIEVCLCVEGGRWSETTKLQKIQNGLDNREDAINKIDLYFVENFVETQMWGIIEKFEQTEV